MLYLFAFILVMNIKNWIYFSICELPLLADPCSLMSEAAV